MIVTFAFMERYINVVLTAPTVIFSSSIALMLLGNYFIYLCSSLKFADSFLS